MKTKLEIKRMQRKKPNFTRQQSYVKRLESKWRRPRARTSKVRKYISGHKTMPSIGYASPKAEKHLNRYGLQEVLVSNINDLSNLNFAKHAIVISGKLGLNKKLNLIEKIKQTDFHVMNIKDLDAFITKSKEDLKKKKEAKKAKQAKKTETKKKAEKKVEEKKEVPKKELTPEEKAKAEKEEQRKVLEKKT